MAQVYQGLVGESDGIERFVLSKTACHDCALGIGTGFALGLAWDSGLDPMRVVLIEISVSLTLGACSDILMTVVDLSAAADFAKRLMGTLDRRSRQDVSL